MPEIKHTFTSGKMNKDLDERLVKNGEYRDAMNVQVRTTDGDAAGTVQNIQGNYKIGESYTSDWMSATAAPYSINSSLPFCVGSIADEKNDKAYFFFSTPMGSPPSTFQGANQINDRTYIDTIVEQSLTTSRPVVVDVFKIIHNANAVIDKSLFPLNTTGWVELPLTGLADISNIRVGMRIKLLNYQGATIGDTAVIKAIEGNSLLLTEAQNTNIFEVNNSEFLNVSQIIFEADRVLNFKQSANESRTLITGINIIDDLLFWTDNKTEPKKINIKRCLAGTNASGYVHTKLFVEDPDSSALVNINTIQNNIQSDPVDSSLKEEHITVLRKAPRTPPTLDMKDSDRDGLIEITISNNPFINDGSNQFLNVNDSVIIEDTQLSGVSFLKDDILLFTETSSSTRLKFKLIRFLDSNSNESLTSTNKIELEVVSNNLGLTSSDNDWLVTLEQTSPLFELKLGRFGYRYKYEDGEYSSFSPWSELAFLPSEFEYTRMDAYNLGMMNTLRELTIKDFIPYGLPMDVSSVDILYKTTDSPSVYIVETIDRVSDNEWELFTPNGTSTSITTGSLSITSEMVHRVLPDNQILRTWDNVPRNALAQEVVGNRLLYGNYTQGYNIGGPINLTQQLSSKKIDTSQGLLPQKSIKSIRDYKVGMVFGDKYGRETPVITSGYTSSFNDDVSISLTGDISVDKSFCALQNSLVVSQNWDAGSNPDSWIDYVKYYIKETSNEYYNLIMDRWYEAGDDTAWISFNSSDRNKVDEETYLILKNQNGNNEPVLSESRYKIIAIENEAPDYIKTENRLLGILGDGGPGDGEGGIEPENSVGIWDGTVNGDENSNPPNGFINSTSIKISKQYWDQFFGGGDFASTVFGKKLDGSVQFRVIGENWNGTSQISTYTRKSEWRTLSNFQTTDQSGGGGNIKLTWSEKFTGYDVDHYNYWVSFNAAADGYDASLYNNFPVTTSSLLWTIEFRESIVQNKPEFDGKFFVKIAKDLELSETVLNNNMNTSYIFDGSYDLGYISSTVENEAQDDFGVLAGDSATFSLITPGANNDMFFGVFQGINDYDDGTVGPSSLFETITLVNSDEVFLNPLNESYSPLYTPSGESFPEAFNTSLYEDISSIAYGPDGFTTLSLSGTGAGNGGVFASCTWEHNQMTKEFWYAYANASYTQTGEARGAFLDSARARYMDFSSETNILNKNYRAPSAFGGVGDTIASSSTNSTVGQMTISRVDTDYGVTGNAVAGKPLMEALKITGTLFSFEGNDENIYRIISSEEANSVRNFSKNGDGQYSFQYDGGDFDIINTPEDGEYYNEDCGICDGPDEMVGNYNDSIPSLETVGGRQTCGRVSVKYQFRLINQVNDQSTGLGIDLGEFDPRAYLKHDGSTTRKIFIRKKEVSVYTVDSEDDNSQLGACWETEPKKDSDLELYYEASGAIPMVLNKNNVFDFAPANSSISIKREAVGGSNIAGVKNVTLNNNNHRVNNIYFTDQSDDAIIAVVADTGDAGTIDPATTSLHTSNICINDNIIFTHANSTNTSATITNIYEPVSGVNNFNETTTNDTTLGIVDSPKSFKKVEAQNYTLDINDSLPQIALTSNETLPIGGLLTGVYQTNNSGLTTFVPIQGVNLSSVVTSGSLSVLSFTYINQTSSNGWLTDYGVDTTLASVVVSIIELTGYYGININVWNQPVKLPWHNCYSFGNGVESDRIRDDFNAPTIDNGVKVSTTFSGYKKENIKSGLIYSGIYNSTSKVNDLNEFNMAEKITKELNPTYGSIQALKTRDSDIVVFNEDKILKVLAHKDALFNADGKPQLTASDKVLGQAVPFVGDFGISKNPESLASDQYRLYFTDKQRGAVLRLSRDGLTPISSVGMKSWFRDNLKISNNIIGTFDTVSGEYNATLYHTGTNKPITVSFNEATKGWVSFKSFKPSSGVSVSGKYLTSYKNCIYEHHSNEVDRNVFYGQTENIPPSTVTVLFNDQPSIVKSFKTINYEGSQARITKNTGSQVALTYDGTMLEDASGVPAAAVASTQVFQDNQYNNLVSKEGWWVSKFDTDLEKGRATEFKNKEGKWFSNITGIHDLSNINVSQFSVQGIGQVGEVISTDPIDTGSGLCNPECEDGFVCSGGQCVAIEVVTSGCTDSNANNYNELATNDDGSCFYYDISGCMDPIDPNYNPFANVSQSSDCLNGFNIIGCMNPSATPPTGFGYNPQATVSGTWAGISAEQLADLGLNPELQSDFPAIVEAGGVWNNILNYGCSFGPGGETFVEVLGCTDVNALNYNPLANTNDGDCNYLTVAINYGCTDPDAYNYNSDADTLDGSCLYAGCTDPDSWNYNANADVDDGTCLDPPVGGCNDDGNQTWSPYPGLAAYNYDCALNPNAGGPLQTNMPEVIDNGGINACNDGVNYFCASYDVAGNTIPVNMDVDGDGDLDELNQTFACCVYIVPDDYVPPNDTGCMDNTAFNYDANAINPCDDCCEEYIYGCTDSTMFNYNGDANTDDGSCIPIVYGCTDQFSYGGVTPGANVDDGSCIPTVVGCMDPAASNYMVVFGMAPEQSEYYDLVVNTPCENYNNSTNPYYQCCEYTIYGCMDVNALNFNPNANAECVWAACDGCDEGDPLYFDTQYNYNYDTEAFDIECQPCTYADGTSEEDLTIIVQNNPADTSDTTVTEDLPITTQNNIT